MTAKTTTKPAAKAPGLTGLKAQTEATKARQQARQESAIATLVAAYREANKRLTSADSGVTDALSILDAAKLERSNARVMIARAAYRLATAPGIATKAYPVNQAGAAKAVGANRTTLRHHVIAGEALAKKEMVLRTGAPQEDERAVVENSHDKTSREEAKASKARVAAKRAQKLEAVAQAAASGDVQAMAELMPGKSGDVVTVQAAESTTTTESAPVVVPEDAKDMTAMTLKEILAKLATVEAMVKAYRVQQGGISQPEQDKLEDAFRDIATEAARED